MGKVEETEARVQAALDSFNCETITADGVEVIVELDKYDYKRTHLNAESGRLLSQAIQLYSTGMVGDDTVKETIREFRDASEVGHVDFSIRVLEPGIREYRRLALIFGRKLGERLIPARTEAERIAYLEEKTRLALSSALSHRIVVTDKLAQQFAALMARTKDRSPELLRTAVELETYNPYKRRLRQMHVAVAYEQATEPEMPTPTIVDNSSFEENRMHTLKNNEASNIVLKHETEPTRFEPLEHSEEFAQYCEQLYARNQA